MFRDEILSFVRSKRPEIIVKDADKISVILSGMKNSGHVDRSPPSGSFGSRWKLTPQGRSRYSTIHDEGEMPVEHSPKLIEGITKGFDINRDNDIGAFGDNSSADFLKSTEDVLSIDIQTNEAESAAEIIKTGCLTVNFEAQADFYALKKTGGNIVEQALVTILEQSNKEQNRVTAYPISLKKEKLYALSDLANSVVIDKNLATLLEKIHADIYMLPESDQSGE